MADIESSVDAAYDRYIENLEKSASDLSDDDVMKDVLDSFLASKGADPQSLSLPTPEKRLDLYKTLELEPPPPSEGELTFGSRSWYKDHNLLAPPMTYEKFLKRRYGLDLADLFASPPEPLPSEPRSTDLVEYAPIPEPVKLPSTDLVEHRPGLPRLTGVGRVLRGLGSMIGGPKLRAVRGLITMAQQGYELLPEEQQLLGDVLDMEALTKQIPGTGRGLEYFRQMLGRVPPAPTSQEEREEPTGMAEGGGFVDKPLHGGWNDVF